MKKHFIILSIAFLIAGILLSNLIEETPQETEQKKKGGLNDVCLLKTIQAGESISETAPGFYNYTLIQTSKGIEVWVPCTRL